MTAPAPPLQAAPAGEVAESLGVPTEAVELTRACTFVDLHIDTFIPVRLWGYDPLARHGLGVFRGRFFSHLDLPRATDGGLSGGMWSITTQPFKSKAGRWRSYEKNLLRFKGLVAGSRGALSFCTRAAEVRAARARGSHAVLLSIQGGNALEGAPADATLSPEGLLTRVTLVHLTSSCYGGTSSPLHKLSGDPGLTTAGHAMVERLNHERVFVDLAHIHPKAFWAAVETHSKVLPLICTHTGVSGVYPHWRNLDDDQLRAIADTGGVIGVMFHRPFLGASPQKPSLGPSRPRAGHDLVLDHL